MRAIFVNAKAMFGSAKIVKLRLGAAKEEKEKVKKTNKKSFLISCIVTNRSTKHTETSSAQATETSSARATETSSARAARSTIFFNRLIITPSSFYD